MDAALETVVDEGEVLLGGIHGLRLWWCAVEDPDFQVRCRLFAEETPWPVAERVLSRHDRSAQLDLQPVFHDPNIRHGEIELRFSDLHGGAELDRARGVSLWCNIPLGRSSWHRGVVRTWPDGPGPAPDPEPGPEPPPDPFDPPIDEEGHVRQPWGGAVEPWPARAAALEFLWLEELERWADRSLAFVAFDDGGAAPDGLPLAVQLAADRQASPGDPAKACLAMQGSAGTWLAGAWPPAKPELDLMLQLAAVLEGLAETPEDLGFETMDEVVEAALGMTVDAFVEDQIVAPDGLFSANWQRIYAVILAAPAAAPPPALADALAAFRGLAESVRAMSLVARLAARDPRILEAAARRSLARALLLAPPAIDPPPPAAAAAVQCLGVGVQKTVDQRLDGYRQGEIAEVLNVMPGERLRLLDRNRRRRTEVEGSERVSEDVRRREERTAADSDLIQSLRDALSEAEIVRNYTDLDAQEGHWPELKIGGSWWGQDGDQKRTLNRAAKFIQQLSTGVASAITSKVVERRALLDLHEHESVASRLIDNRESAAGLRGVYHWLEKVYDLRLRSTGRHLVLEFLLADPAMRLRDRTLRAPHLAPPLPPSTWSISTDPAGYASVTADNYASAAAAYGLDLSPPPAAAVPVRAHLSTQQPVAELAIPPGYTAASASVAYVASDGAAPLVALVGDQPVAWTPSVAGRHIALDPAPSPPPPPSIPDPQSFSWTPTTPASGQGSVTFATAAGGPVPVTCLYLGQSFTAVVEAVCAPSSASAALAAWQIAAHGAILAAYDDARAAHAAALSAAVLAQAPDGAGRLIANELTLDALAALAAAAPSPVEPSATPPALSAEASRFFVDALDWRDCVSAFFPWGVDPVRRPSPVRWTGQAMADRNNPAWLDTFLQAGSARLLVSIRRGYETAVLFFLAFGYLPGRPQAGVVPAAARDWLGSLMTPEPREGDHCWRLQIPTDLIALADGPPAWIGSAP